VNNTQPHIYENHLPYVQGLVHRRLESIDLVVIHCTELPDLATAREFGKRVHYPVSGTGNSGHYYIERTGRIEQWVPPHKVAHHVRGYNERSIGIELDNKGRYPDWLDTRRQIMTEAYPSAQIRSLVALLLHLSAELPSLAWIAGHDSLDTSRVAASDNPVVLVYRKRDPGPLFPWPDVMHTIKLERLKP